jgi:hypothetical protein
LNNQHEHKSILPQRREIQATHKRRLAENKGDGYEARLNVREQGRLEQECEY